MLCEGGADILQTTEAGIGPLYLAIKAKSYDCARYLVEQGASIYLSDQIKRDFSPVFAAITTAQVPILELLCDRVKDQMDQFKDS